MTKEKVLFTAIDKIEDYISNCPTILGSYVIVNKTILYNKFKILYEALPKVLVDKRDYLDAYQKENIFFLLNKINYLVEQQISFNGYVLINLNIVNKEFDRIFPTLVKDIKMCGVNRDITLTDSAQIEIPDWLQK